jgi:hypothetical protein
VNPPLITENVNFEKGQTNKILVLYFSHFLSAVENLVLLLLNNVAQVSFQSRFFFSFFLRHTRKREGEQESKRIERERLLVVQGVRSNG